MIEVAPRLFVGSQADFKEISTGPERTRSAIWAIVHACKEPYHREALGYKERGAPKDHPEYLFAHRDHRLMLNLVDVNDPKFIRPEIVNEAVGFIAHQLSSGKRVLVHCNQGHSRGPSIALAYLARSGRFTGMAFTRAEDIFQQLYPDYAPGEGMRGFLQENWDALCR